VPIIRELTGVPAAQAGRLVRDFRDEGADPVEKLAQPDGRFTVRATFRDPTEIAATTAPPQAVGPAANARLAAMALPGALAPVGFAGMLDRAAAQAGVDRELLAALSWAETGFENRHGVGEERSGPFGLTPATWASLVAIYGGQTGLTAVDLARPSAQAIMAARLLGDILARLAAGLGRTPTDGDLLLAQFFGVPVATALLQAPPGEPVETALRRFFARTAVGPGFVDRLLARFSAVLRTATGRVRPVSAVRKLFERRMAEARERAAELFGVAQAASAEPVDPPWLSVALAELAAGVREIAGDGSNPRIEAYHACAAGGAARDGVPWCGSFLAFCLDAARSPNLGSKRAADWLRFGQKLDGPRRGCIVVLAPQSAGASGHVGFWMGQRDGKVLLLGGNQSDAVCIAPFRLADVRRGGYRWPA
jgi:uncharacterized protein (TIGR02594 family)